ncbi:hypothetical protein KIN34_06400 [Cellulomonas sp. DKR-3]|uniref:DNA-binding protein n=1 Tax=Cellulomonas fulva TaxID=2835530 RepID=A0ABS5TXR1_9CELL|nr:hypothetical protein [Cellulomonas fulva]MBT0993916.1 hypothetical protein [Cellulomonas fulva]
MPQDPGPVEGLYDAPRLAQRLGITTATLRQHRLTTPRPAWLPEPAGELNGGAVWRAQDLRKVEELRGDMRPGRRTDLEQAQSADNLADAP